LFLVATELEPAMSTAKSSKSSRRDFLKRSVISAGSGLGVAVGLGVPHVWVSRYALGGQSPNERLGVGCIGVGGRGSGIGNQACQLGVKIACADVDRNGTPSASPAKTAAKCTPITGNCWSGKTSTW
jgi:hypothetical protein